ncbi:hypothetical protein TanjilG_20080 [Lupinus angustifolius]|uniref:Uncharacterized protein n=1 Tax=Lupinus angustifolius TaxID=3871 RepID=A0A4P1RCZ4_LUPAN|nr:hypothetical protein TanjilG_20080 [Lupinus angustifolius]
MARYGGSRFGSRWFSGFAMKEWCLLRQHGRDLMDGDQASEISNDIPTVGYLVSDLTSQIGRSHLLQELNQKPPGLTQEAIDCLHQHGDSIGVKSTAGL